MPRGKGGGGGGGGYGWVKGQMSKWSFSQIFLSDKKVYCFVACYVYVVRCPEFWLHKEVIS